MKATDSKYDFPVTLAPITVVGGKVIPHARAIVRTDTDEPLEVVGNKYHLFTHAQAVNATDKFLQGFGQHRIDNVVERNGSRFLRTCTFKDHGLTVTSPKINDTVHFRLTVFNTYDRKSALKIKVCAMVLKCLNGMTVPGGGLELKFSHLAGIEKLELPDPEHVMKIFRNGAEKWNEWADIELKPSYHESILENTLRMDVISPTTLKKREDLLEPDGDINAWQYFNNFTNVITHHLPRIQHTTRLRRLDRLNTIFDKVIYGKKEEGFLATEYAN